MTAKICVTALLLTACVLPAAAQKFERKEMKTFEVVETPMVRISGEFGPIKVKTHAQSTVEVKVRILCEGESSEEAKAMAAKVGVRISGTREKVDVDVEMPEDFNDAGDRSVRTGIFLIVPLKTAVTVRNRFGGVEVNGVTGSASIDCEYGAVEVRQSSNVRVESGFGSVTLGSVGGSVAVRTKMGQLIAYDVAGGSFANQYGSTEITNAKGPISIDAKMGNVTARSIRGGRIKNAYGNIDVTLAADFSGEIHAATSFGNIDSPLPMKTKSDEAGTSRKALIKAGGGQDRLSLDCSFGNIDVHK
jgi:hypothetical protein